MFLLSVHPSIQRRETHPQRKFLRNMEQSLNRRLFEVRSRILSSDG